MSNQGIPPSEVFKGGNKYAYSIYTKDPRYLLREDEEGVQAIGKMVDGEFEVMGRHPTSKGRVRLLAERLLRISLMVVGVSFWVTKMYAWVALVGIPCIIVQVPWYFITWMLTGEPMDIHSPMDWVSSGWRWRLLQWPLPNDWYNR